MPLTWSDEPGIAKALLAAYPEEDRLALDPSALCGLITQLSDFSDTPEPPHANSLSAVLWLWMRFADAGDDFIEPDSGALYAVAGAFNAGTAHATQSEEGH